MARYHYSVQDALSLYVYKWEVQKHTFYLVGVMVAYLFYMQRAVVRFHYEVQNWVVKVVRIRQPDCKSGPFGSGSSPLLPTMIMVFSISRMSTIQDRFKNSAPPAEAS